MKRTGGPNFNTQIFTWLKQKVIVRAERVNVQVSLQRSLQNPLKKRPNPNFHRGKKDTNNPFHSKRNSNLKFLLLQSKKNPFSLKGKNTQHVRYPGKGWRQKQGLVGSATGKLLQKKQAGASFRANEEPGKGGLGGAAL